MVARQKELPGMPEKGPLAKLCDEFLDLRDSILDAEKKQDALMQPILEQMNTDGVMEFTHGGIVFIRDEIHETKLRYRVKREKGVVGDDEKGEGENPA
jgi:hypothetical protein